MGKIRRLFNKEKRYRVQHYSHKTIAMELGKVFDEYYNKVVQICDMQTDADPYEYRSQVAHTVKALDSWFKLIIQPRIKTILSERSDDLDKYQGRFFHSPISDPYIRQQFFEASKESFEMELESLRNRCKSIIDPQIKRCEGYKAQLDKSSTE